MACVYSCIYMQKKNVMVFSQETKGLKLTFLKTFVGHGINAEENKVKVAKLDQKLGTNTDISGV